MKRSIGFLAIAGLLLIAAPAERAHALSLANPATAATTKNASDNLGMTTEVRWHHRHWGWRRHHWRHHHRWHRRYRYY
jgi:hypothetical protein